jgi:signal transduction histidine kinase
MSMREDVAAALQPYSANELLALVFLIQAGVFMLARRRTGEPYFKGLSIGMLMAAVAWGTTRLQSPGQPYVDWAWFWAQPFFAGALVAIGLSILDYLPMQDQERQRMRWWVWVPVAVYIVGMPLLMLADVKVLRLWAVLVQLPAIIVPALAALRANHREPGMGHAFIGLTMLSLPVITIAVALSGATTLVLRFWTAIPTVIVTLTILTVSHLRDRRHLLEEVERRRRAEAEIAEANASLERRVRQRTAELRDIVDGLESFNRNVSHDLRGPLGGIDMMAYTAEHLVARGHSTAAIAEIRRIGAQVRDMQGTVDALLLLARTMKQPMRTHDLDLDLVARHAVDEATASLKAQVEGRNLPKVVIERLGRGDADPDLLRIILVNLVGNALKFNLGNEQVTVRILREYPASAGRGSHGRDAAGDNQVPPTEAKDSSRKRPLGAPAPLVLVVSDNGKGFPAEGTEQAFEPFRRLDNASGTQGHGLGLSIVRRAVERQGGHVELSAAGSSGVQVRFTLNTNTADPSASDNAPEGSPRREHQHI